MAPPGVVAVKSPEAFRTISEVAAMLDVPQHVLRFWESRFPQIKPVKRAGGRRFYRPEDVDLLRGIRLLLYFEGYTIRGAQKILREKGVRYTAALGREQAGNRRASGTPEQPALEAEENGFDARAALARAHDGAAETLAQEEIAHAEPEPATIPAPPAVAAEAPPADDPRRIRLETLRAELVELKSRLATARRNSST